MKKDKAVRKAERKAALQGQLKNLIVSLVVLAVIAVGVGIVLFWKEEPEPVEIIKVNGYEGEEKEFVLENDRLRFVLDAETTQFTVTVKDTGKVWYSNPPEGGEDPRALTLEKDKLRSTLLLTYSTINGVDTLYPNYTYSMEKGIYEIEADGNSVKVFYSVGDMDKEYIIPPVITEERAKGFLDKMESAEVLMFNDYYKKYDINNLGKKDNKDELLANYPILETEVAYILRSTVKDNIKSKLEVYFAKAGYTTEDYAVDKAMDTTQTVTEKPVFNVNVEYRLDGEDLVVEVPVGEIEYKDEYPLLYLSILPYFGAAGEDEEGYMLVPEGGGAIIDFNNGRVAQNGYYANVYGWDMSQGRSAVVHETRTYYNVFGIAQGDDSFLCIMEEGAPHASIQADISGKTNSYNYANALYRIAHREQYDVSDKYNGKMFVYEEGLPQESLVSRYRFVDSGEYVEMAGVYRGYLEKRYGDYLSMNSDTAAPAAIEILGAVDKVKQILGVPVSRPLELTEYDEAQEILSQLAQDGVENLSVKLSGWMNGGVKQKLLKKVKPVSSLGGKKDLQALTDYAAKNGVKLYLDGVTNYAYDSGAGEGFLEYRDAARFVSNEKVELLQYSTVTYGEEHGEDSYYLLNAGLIDQMVGNLAGAARKYNANVSFRDMGMDLSADYTKDAAVSREAARKRQAEELKGLKDSGMGIMINMGNDYAIPYSDMVTNMDLRGSEYTIINRKVPFFQLAIHGYVNYTGESLNLAQDYEQEILESAEYGAGLAFTLMKETSFILQNTKYSQYFGTGYDAWHDRLVEIYTRYNRELGHVFCQRMTGHENLQEKLSCTTYEDGTKVYVNYGYTDQEVDGKTVPARDYAVVR